jgi:uncharacterized protein (DUF697 family)
MSKKPSREAQLAELTTKIASVLQEALEQTVESRRAYFATSPHKRPSPLDGQRVIQSYANQNFMIAGAANLIPGPLGVIAALPELTLIIRNQLQMIYDLGVAYGKQDEMTTHALLGIFASALGEGMVGLATVEGRNLIIKRTSLKVVQKLLQWLGGKISQRLLKHILAKWVPIAGAVLMAAWSRQSTLELGQRAQKMLQYDIKFTNDEFREEDIPS